jgi:hypothetical protein
MKSVHLSLILSSSVGESVSETLGKDHRSENDQKEEGKYSASRYEKQSQFFPLQLHHLRSDFVILILV